MASRWRSSWRRAAPRDFSLNEIAAGLDAPFSLLNQGHRTALPRHQTLEGMIDWSFALLTPHEQRLFARLGLFGESFSPDAVANICGEDPAASRDALVGLIAKSLIDVVEDREGRLRYRLLETMRMYALDRLGQAGERDRYAHRFAQYFCDVAKQADSLYGRISNKEWWAQPIIATLRLVYLLASCSATSSVVVG